MSSAPLIPKQETSAVKEEALFEVNDDDDDDSDIEEIYAIESAAGGGAAPGGGLHPHPLEDNHSASSPLMMPHHSTMGQNQVLL